MKRASGMYHTGRSIKKEKGAESREMWPTYWTCTPPGREGSVSPVAKEQVERRNTGV